MAAVNRKRQKAAQYTNPGCEFQGMALTYKRAAPAMMQRRSPRAPQPTRQARGAAEKRQARRVHISSTEEGEPSSHETVRPVDPLLPTPSLKVPGVPDKYAYKE